MAVRSWTGSSKSRKESILNYRGSQNGDDFTFGILFRPFPIQCLSLRFRNLDLVKGLKDFDLQLLDVIEKACNLLIFLNAFVQAYVVTLAELHPRVDS